VTSSPRLRHELGRRGLTLTGATAGTYLHRIGDSLADALAECRQVAALLAAVNAPYLITLPAMYTDLYTGDLL
jgi:inosose dehydratase